MPSSSLMAVCRYGGAIVAVILATAARRALDPVLGDSFPLVMLFVAVIVVAAYAGRGPALLATGLGVVVAARLLLQPRDSFELRSFEDRAGLVLYAVIGIGFAMLGGALRAARIRAENDALEATRQRELTQATLASIGDGVVVTDAVGQVASMNPVAESLTGLTSLKARGKPLDEVVRIADEETRKPVENPALRAVREGTIVGLSGHNVLIADCGSEHTIDASASPIRAGKGEIIGAVFVFRDVSTRRAAEWQLRRDEETLRLFVEHAPAAVAMLDRDMRYLLVSRRWLADFGFGDVDVRGQNHYDVFPNVPDRWREIHRRCLAGAVERADEDPYTRLDGRQEWLRWETRPWRDDRGEVGGIIIFSEIITERKANEQTARFLADASARLASPIDYDGTLQTVASLAVPAFADWVVVDMGERDGPGRRLVVAHSDPSKADLALALYRRYRDDPSAAGAPTRVLRTGNSQFATAITEATLVAGGRDEDDLRNWQQLGPRSYVCVPLTVRGETLGVVTFWSTQAGRRYSERDLAVAEDLASRAATAIENALLYAELKNADHSKNQFLATLAHELRNPLAPIRNVLHLMRQPAADNDGFGADRAIAERQIVHLTRLIDDLMDIARISHGKIELHRELVDLGRAIGQAVETSRPLLSERSHRLTLKVPDQVIWLEADPTRLEQILWNLLNNSAKYTPNGGEISLVVEAVEGEVVLRVRDTGIGIKPEMLPRIFDMFVQVKDHEGHSQDGLGIGLCLVRTLVEMHEGSITAHSDGPGHGSEFAVRLPRPARSSVVTVPATDRHHEPGGKPPRCRVLVVDDNVDAATSLGTLLRLHGQEVRVANDGAEALSVAREFRPQVILLDIGMPRMDGNEVVRRLREFPEFEKILIVALTGWGRESDEARTRAAGFDHHLVKPADPGAILDLLTKTGIAVT